MRGEVLVCSRTDGVVTLTVNRPEEKNMLSDEVIALLHDRMSSVDQDPSVRVVVLRGEGREFFCGGIFNPLQMARLSPEQIRLRRRRANDLFDGLERLTHPVVAAINGRAQAGGFEMALACDIRVAVSHATFCMPENTWGCFRERGDPCACPGWLERAKPWRSS